MPLYDVECQTCLFQFEELCKHTDKVLCPKCNSFAKLLISLPADHHNGAVGKLVDDVCTNTCFRVKDGKQQFVQRRK